LARTAYSLPLAVFTVIPPSGWLVTTPVGSGLWLTPCIVARAAFIWSSVLGAAVFAAGGVASGRAPDTAAGAAAGAGRGVYLVTPFSVLTSGFPDAGVEDDAAPGLYVTTPVLEPDVVLGAEPPEGVGKPGLYVVGGFGVAAGAAPLLLRGAYVVPGEAAGRLTPFDVVLGAEFAGRCCCCWG
jgi:hypothetical protein